MDSIASAVACLGLKKSNLAEMPIALFAGFFCIVISYTAVCNKFVDNLRINYIKEQLEDDPKAVYIIELPYINNFDDYIFMFKDEDDFKTEKRTDKDTNLMYKEAMCAYYGIDESFLEKNYLWISTMDYYS